MKNKSLAFISATVMTIFPIAACTPFSEELKPPAAIPISIREPGNILDIKIKITDHRIYDFSLRFFFNEKDNIDRQRLKSLIGGNETNKSGMPLNPGRPTPVWLGIYTVDAGQEIEVFTKEIDPILTSWGADDFSKQIGFTELKPGNYILRLNSLRASPEFNETPVALVIGYNIKNKFHPKK